MTTNEFQVTGMSCGHCEATVRKHVSQVAGVENVDVSAASGRLIVTSSADVAEEAIIAAVDEAGYEAVSV